MTGTRPLTDSVTRETLIAAPLARVWQAISDHREFGTWFEARLDAPFVEGATIGGQMTTPGFEHLPWICKVVTVDPPRLLSFRWPAYDPDAKEVKPDLPWTLVEFRLTAVPEGTKVAITEGGFDALPGPIGSAMLKSNTHGWEIQLGRIAAHVRG